VLLPARATLVAAMNPCPCGAAEAGGCSCPPSRVEAYRRKVSGPVLDRLDLGLRIGRPSAAELRGSAPEGTEAVRARVQAARARQRLRGEGPNGRLGPGALRRVAVLDVPSESLLARAADRLRLSPRAVDRAIRVARTAADLDGVERLTTAHLGEALSLRLGGLT
jgi:magnesium chelatase family protein